MKIKDLRKKSPKDLEKEAIKLRDEIAKTEMEKFTSDDKNYKKQRNQRRDLARILTLLNTDQEEAAEDKKSADDKKEDK